LSKTQHSRPNPTKNLPEERKKDRQELTQIDKREDKPDNPEAQVDEYPHVVKEDVGDNTQEKKAELNTDDGELTSTQVFTGDADRESLEEENEEEMDLT
jgi:hypothetical protein